MTLPSTLTTLERSGLIRLAHSLQELEYLFRHAMVQEAAYLSLVKSDRKRLHMACGEVLERLYPDRGSDGELAALLGGHFAEAGESARAARYLERAADAAARTYANVEALAHYNRALDLACALDDSELVQRLYSARGIVLERSGDYPGALKNYEDMEAWAAERANRRIQLASLIHRATIHSIPSPVFDPTRAGDLSDHALRLARELGDRQAEAKTLWNLMLLQFFSRRPGPALEYGERSLAIARELDLREQLAFTLNDIAMNGYLPSGDIERGLAALQEAQGLWRELRNLPMLANAQNSAAFARIMTGEWEMALALAEEGFELSRSIGNAWGMSHGQGVRAYVLTLYGEADSAIQAAEEAIELGDRVGFLGAPVISRSLEAFLFGLLGAHARGLTAARDCVARLHRLPFWNSQGWGTLAFLLTLNGELDEAETVLAQARTAAGEGDPMGYGWMLDIAEGELKLAQGEFEPAASQMAGYVARVRQFGARGFAPFGLVLQGRALLRLGRWEEARAGLEEARRESERMHFRHGLWRALAGLAEVEEALGRSEAARQLREEARPVIDFLLRHAGPVGLDQAFSGLPEVQKILNG